MEQHTEMFFELADFLKKRFPESDQLPGQPTVMSAVEIGSQICINILWNICANWLFPEYVSHFWQTESSFTKIFRSISFISHLTEMDSSSLIHLFHWWLTEFTALLYGRSCCLSLNFPSDSTGSTPLPLVQRRLNIALLKRLKAVFPHQHQEFGTLLLSLCDSWWLFSLPQLFFCQILNRFKLQILMSLQLQTWLLLEVSIQSASQLLWE